MNEEKKYPPERGTNEETKVMTGSEIMRGTKERETERSKNRTTQRKACFR